MSQVLAVNDDQLTAAINQGNAVVAEFWAPWCTQCAAMSAVMDKLADTLESKATLLTVNIEDEPGVIDRHHIETLPALLLFRDGRLQTRLDGFKRFPVVLEALRPHL